MIDVSKIVFGVLCFFCVCLLLEGRRWTFLLRILLRGGLYCLSCPAQPPFSLRKSIKAVGPGPLYQFRCSERLWIIEAVNGERERRENKD